MKKSAVALVLLGALVLGLSSCQSGKPKAQEVLSGKIAAVYDGSCLVAGSGVGGLYTVSTSIELYDENNKALDASALKAGQEVEIGYSGTVMDSYPAQLGAPVYIQITSQGDDMIGFYQTVLGDLWNADEGLNGDITVLGFDLSGVTNLTDAEKSALIYLVSGEHGANGVSGTFDELCEQGYIDGDQLLFGNGLLFQIVTSDVTAESFSFDASKWRSGTGADYWNDCRATKGGEGWTYTMGSQAVA